MTEPTSRDTAATTMPDAVRRAVLAMPMARTLQLRFVHLAAGEVELEMPVLPDFCFTPGQLQATAVFALADFAGVAAAGTVLPPGWINATVDGSIKLFAPARGACLRARGRVLQAGRVLSVCAAEVYAIDAEGASTHCASWIGSARNHELRAAA